MQKTDWTDVQRAMLAPYEKGDRPDNVYTTMANYPDLMRDWIVFVSHVLRRNLLAECGREVLILRIGRLCQAEYEWAQHVRIGRSVDMTDDDIQHIMGGPTATGLSKERSNSSACDG